jgi:putative SOS response-associated peptidase YedK
MLTTEPGPDVAPYHGRQVAVLQPDQWMPWLTYAQPASALLGPAPAGTLEVSAANAA